MKNFSRLSNCRTVEFVLIGHTPSPVLKASLGTNYCPEHDVIRSGGLFFAPSPLLFFISPMKEVWHPLAEELLIRKTEKLPRHCLCVWTRSLCLDNAFFMFLCYLKTPESMWNLLKGGNDSPGTRTRTRRCNTFGQLSPI